MKGSPGVVKKEKNVFSFFSPFLLNQHFGGFFPTSSGSINQYNKIIKNGVGHHSIHSQQYNYKYIYSTNKQLDYLLKEITIHLLQRVNEGNEQDASFSPSAVFEILSLAEYL